MNNDVINLLVREGYIQNFDDTLKLFADAREYFKKSGIDQWQEEPIYPNKETLENDKNMNAWFVVENTQTGEILATFMTKVLKDITYEKELITGKWALSGKDYGVLHRVAVKNSAKGLGLGTVIVNFAKQHTLKSGGASLRCDTHSDNASMLRMLIKNNFTKCGDMILPSGAPRIAFELIL